MMSLHTRKAMLKLLFDTWDEDGSGTLDIQGKWYKPCVVFGEGLSEDQLVLEALEIVHQMNMRIMMVKLHSRKLGIILLLYLVSLQMKCLMMQ